MRSIVGTAGAIVTAAAVVIGVNVSVGRTATAHQAAGPLAAPTHGSSGAPIPVVVELFTSEGCSSCPPADAALARLSAERIPGAAVIVLSEHVDYWDGPGWKDPFSSPSFSARQDQYARVFHGAGLYTPQMVVNGREQFVGSDYTHAISAVQRAIRAPALAIEIQPDARSTTSPGAASTGTVGVTVALSAPAATTRPLDVLAAIAESDLTTVVRGGENGGRTLHHTGVVRRLKTVGRVERGASRWSRPVTLAVDSRWVLPNLSLVVLAQDPVSREIVAAATTPIRGMAP